ncbi:MAG: hypothetical protein K0R09_55 [Clostridiales bacterium]|nr:hypothetical protein [Clostridiales bacterium]
MEDNVNNPNGSLLSRRKGEVYMKLVVDKATIDYVKGKGRVINIDLYTSKSCCAGITEPIVKFGDPKLIHQFDVYFIDDIKIYVNRFIQPRDDGLTLHLNKFLGIKSISVSGVKML